MDSIKGVVKRLGQPENKQRDPAKKPFWIMEIVVESVRYGQDGTPYYNTLPIQIKENKFGLVQGIQQGMEVEAEFFINGREFNKKDGSGVSVFVSLDLSKITVVTQVQYSQQGQPMNHVQQPQYIQQPPQQQQAPQQYQQQVQQPQYAPQQGGVIPPTQIPPNIQAQPIPGVANQNYQVPNPNEEEDDLPFVWLLLVGLTGLTGLASVIDFSASILTLPF